MLLADLVAVSAQVGATRSRNAKTQLVAEVLAAAAEVEPDEVEVVAAYLSGVLPQRRVGVGYRTLAATPAPSATPGLTVAQTDEAMQQLADAGGPGSAGAREQILRTLLASATAVEQTFLKGLITGELRQGAQDGVMLAAIASAAQVPAPAVRRAVMLAGFTAPVASAALRGGAPALAEIGLVPGRPLRPMLAASATTVGDAMQAVTTPGDAVGVECKLDGIRIQAHKLDEEVRLFTRSLEEVTDRLPEIVEAVLALPGERLVLDGEVIALREDGVPQPFQVTGARTASRKDPAQLRVETPVTPWFFDVLHIDGDDLIDAPARERWERLTALVPQDYLIPRVQTADPEVAQRFFQEKVSAGHEGVVVKSLDAPYAAGRRGAGWVKVKPRHTLDLVVLAVERGSGRRTGLLSNIHLGARDPESGEFVMLGKTFKGMTDEMLAWQTERFTELATEDDGWTVTVRPEQVVEIAFDGVQRSTRYPGGMALRFARVLRYRDDKRAEEADTVALVREVAQWES
ncbi:ATP-dependent DNA ligase [Allobranchiibius sp. GilTou73]|uniref:ATP-dependent DNA ligase n=1 Tax=Allobranchiibius sp. GilTou73 TaxID=2904523 RepID=UPI001F29844B|nr:ATP-dependent DNA ligase [Allobranchiibius sp. GilTou73]UIJ33921.1 ATP-dependent DNA ligase [Allobranchiibius sp. GilTou73]